MQTIVTAKEAAALLGFGLYAAAYKASQARLKRPA